MSEDKVTPKDRNILLEDPQRDNAPYHELMIARAASLQAYANVEQSLSILFATLLKTDFETAAIVFFRIVNTRSRMIILEDLIKKRYETTYNLFWNSVAKLTQSLDGTRNQIIHWHVVKNLNFEGDQAISTFTLNPPNFWTKSEVNPISSVDLITFSHKSDFISRLLNMFSLVLRGQHHFESEQTWLEIFRQPATYPPPNTHPLYRKPTEP
jgi:hypothetical protein